VNLAVIRTHLISESGNRNVAGLLRYGLIPLVGMSLTLWLWTSLSTLTLTIGLCWFGLGLAYLMVLTGGFRRPVRAVNFSEAA
jgi:putrescine importer